MHQNLKRPASSHAAYEYPAYALQVESLPPDVRDTFLRSVPNRSKPGELVFNDAILLFDPFFFAVHAYEQLKSATDGCAQFHALLDGQARFRPKPAPLISCVRRGCARAGLWDRAQHAFDVQTGKCLTAAGGSVSTNNHRKVLSHVDHRHATTLHNIRSTNAAATRA